MSEDRVELRPLVWGEPNQVDEAQDFLNSMSEEADAERLVDDDADDAARRDIVILDNVHKTYLLGVEGNQSMDTQSIWMLLILIYRE